MDSTSHECVFLGDKLGMLFNSHGGKVTVIGLDSKQYKQSTTFPLSSPLQTTPGKSTSCEDLEKEENKKYDDAIMLSPAGKGSKKERGDEILSSASTSAKQDKIEIKEANTMTAVEMLSALANFEDGPDGIDQTETVEERTGPVAMALFDEGSPQPATEGPAFSENLVASESYEDFQTTLNATLASSSMSAKYAPSSPRAGAAVAATASATSLNECESVDQAVSSAEREVHEAFEGPRADTPPEMDSPFGSLASLDAAAPSAHEAALVDAAAMPLPSSPAPPIPVRPPEADPARAAMGGEEPPAPPVLTLTPPAPHSKSFASSHAPYYEPLHADGSGGHVDPAGQIVPVSPRAVHRSARQLARLFGTTSPFPAPHRSVCSHRTWLVLPATADHFIMHSVDHVNTVQVRDLDSAFQLALIKQRQRPLTLKFRAPAEARSPTPASHSSTTASAAHTDSDNGAAENTLGEAERSVSPHQSPRAAPPAPEKLKYSLFMAKYTSTAATKVRSTVDSTLQDYVQCDWAAAKANGQGLPQTTIVSIYRYIECELVKLELFNHAHAKGYGVPAVMEDSHWDDLRNHIESLVFRAVGPFTRTLWPIFSVDTGFDFVDTEEVVSDLKANTFIGVDLSVDTVASRGGDGGDGEGEEHDVDEDGQERPSGEPIVELSKDHPLRMKLAFLRFVTIESTGLDCGIKKSAAHAGEEGGGSASNNGSAADTIAVVQKMRAINRAMLQREEWYLAMRGLCRSLQLETPGEVLAGLASTVKLISHALDAYLNNYPETVEGRLTCAQSCIDRSGRLMCDCGGVHLRTPDAEYTLQSDTVFPATCVTNSGAAAAVGEHLTAPTSVTATAPVDGSAPAPVVSPVDAAPETLSAVVEDLLLGKRVLKRAENGAPGTANKREPRILSADDLMPAITYVLLQANPPNIEYVLWMCTEFRHPELLRGEEAFCLAQLSSAMEFCKHADHRAFDIPHNVYNACMLAYTATLKLLLACKADDLVTVRDLIESQNADINGLAPDHKDSPLSACVRFGRHAILRYLLSLPGIEVDGPVQLFHGPNQRSTPLILATRYNQLEMVIDLLVAGADRHYADDAGVSAMTLAVDNDYTLLQLVLRADPCLHDLVEVVEQGDKLCAIGLLLQRIEVNYLEQPAGMRSPLMAAVVKKDLHLLRFLLTRSLCQVDVDQANALGQTALIICAQEFIRAPCVDYLHIAAMLLRYGADRYLTDCHGKSALQYLKEAREELKALERELLNPFQYGQAVTPPGVPSRDHTYRLNPFLKERDDDMPPTPRVPAPPPPPTEPAPPPPPSVPVPVSAAVVSAPTKKRHSQSLPPPAPSAPPPPPPVPAEAPPLIQGPSAPPAMVVHPEHKQLLKDFALMLSLDPLSPNTAPIYELARDRRIHEVRALLLQGVDVNAVCPQKGYTALIAAVYNSDLPMVKLLLRAEEICRKTYFSVQFSILSAIKSVIKGTEELVEADAELRINEDGVTEGEKDGYLRTVDNSEKEYLSAPNSPLFKRRRHRWVATPGSADSNSSADIDYHATLRFAGKTNVIDIDCAGRNGMRALHYASQIGDIRIVGALLQAGANREVFNNKLHTPLDVCLANNHIAAANAVRFDPEKVSICLAAKHGDWTVMSALLCQGVSINTQRNHVAKNSDALQHELYTPLLAAVAYGQVEVVKRILELPEVNVNLANPLNQTALMFAAARGDENVVLMLLAKGADRWVLDNQGYIATAWAESRKRDSIVLILKHDPARIWIHDVIRNNDFPAVIAMLKQKVDVNQRRFTKHVPNSPANAAVANIDAVGSHPAGEKGTPDRKRGSKSAIDTPTVDALGYSSASGLGFIDGETPLIIAARYGRLDVIAILLKAPPPAAVQVNLADAAGNTPLHHAAAKGHEEAVLLLLKAQASRHARNLLGLTPNLVAKTAGHQQIAAIIETDPYLVHIHDMCEQGELKNVIALLKQGCPPNYQDERAMKRMQTPLMAAASGGQADVVRMLLRIEEVQQNIDLQDSLGRTALMRAAAVGALNVTALLLNAGCDRTIKDNEGMTARDHASKHSYTVMFQFISQTMVR